MTREEIEAIVRETLTEEFGAGPRMWVRLGGAQSYKSLGRAVGDALVHAPIVVVIGTEIRTVAGKRPWWKGP